MLTPWRRKRALGYSSGFLSSDMKEKKATWPGLGGLVFGRFYRELGYGLGGYVPAYAKMMLVTASKAS